MKKENQIICADSSDYLNELYSFENYLDFDICVTSPPYKDIDSYSPDLIGHTAEGLALHAEKDALIFVNFGHLTGFKSRPFEVCDIFSSHFYHQETFIWVKNHYRPIQGKRRVNNLFEYVFMFSVEKKCPELDRLSVGIPYVDKCLSKETELICRFDGEIRYTTLKSLYKTWNKNIYTKIQLPSYDFDKKKAVWVDIKRLSDIKKDYTKELKLRNGSFVSATDNHKFPIFKINKRKEKQVLSCMTIYEIKQRLTKWKTGKVMMYVTKDMSTLLDDDKTSPIFSYDTGYIMGLYLAEGFKGSHNNQFCFSAHKNESFDKNFGLFIENYFKEYFDVSVKRYYNPKTKAMTFHVTSQSFAGILNEYIIGNNAKTKHLNINKCLSKGGKFLSGIIDGYCVGDGHHIKKYDYWSFGTGINRKLIKCIRTFCLFLGYEFKQYKDRIATAPDGKKHSQQSFWIRKSLKTRQNIKDNGLYSEKIESINEKYGKGKSKIDVIDIEIDNDHRMFFLANGMMTHNSNIGRYSDKDLKCAGNVLYIPYETVTKKEEKLHNDRFPIGLPEHFIKLSGKPKNSLVIDPFCGSGTTCVAAKKLGMCYFGIDINPEHVKVASERVGKV